MKIWGINSSVICVKQHPDIIKNVFLTNGFHNEYVIKLLKNHNIHPKYIEGKLLNKLANLNRHQGIVLEIDDIRPLTWDVFLNKVNQQLGFPLVLLLDHIVDPHNLGAIMRTAHLFGVSGIILCNRNQVGITSTVITVSTGAALAIPVFVTANLKVAIRKLQALDYWIYSTTLGEEATPYREVDFQSAIGLILGNEGKGVSMHVTKAADSNIFIPMRTEYNSLNVSVAAAILIEYIKYKQKVE